VGVWPRTPDFNGAGFWAFFLVEFHALKYACALLFYWSIIGALRAKDTRALLRVVSNLHRIHLEEWKNLHRTYNTACTAARHAPLSRHLPLDCHTTVSLYCHTTVSLHCHTTASLDCHTTVSLDCHTTVSLYCHTAVSISQLHVARVIVLCFAFCTKCVCFFSSTNTALRWKRNFLPISQWRSQLGGSNFWLRQATIICFGYRLPKRKMTGYSQNFGGPLGLRLCYFCGASLASSRSSLTFESFVIKTVTVEFFLRHDRSATLQPRGGWWSPRCGVDRIVLQWRSSKNNRVLLSARLQSFVSRSRRWAGFRPLRFNQGCGVRGKISDSLT